MFTPAAGYVSQWINVYVEMSTLRTDAATTIFIMPRVLSFNFFMIREPGTTGKGKTCKEKKDMTIKPF